MDGADAEDVGVGVGSAAAGVVPAASCVPLEFQTTANPTITQTATMIAAIAMPGTRKRGRGAGGVEACMGSSSSIVCRRSLPASL